MPEKVAVKLSYPERINSTNMERMRDAIINGSRLHPGANVLETKNWQGQPMRIALHMVRDRERRIQMARDLKVGDVVHRHIRDGEYAIKIRET